MISITTDQTFKVLTSMLALIIALSLAVVKQARHVVRVDTWLCERQCSGANKNTAFSLIQTVLVARCVPRLNFFEETRAAFFSKY